MEINLNSDLGEKTANYNFNNDSELMAIINSANIACGYHAGNKEIIDQTIKLAKKNKVSIGAHPGFDDKKNFGRKRINLSLKEIDKLITNQLETIFRIAEKNNYSFTHVKPHGALNNMACEDLNLAKQIGQSIKRFNDNLIYLVLPETKMHLAASKINIKYACEVFADRNYDENGYLIDRKNLKSIINNPNNSIVNILEMIEKKSIKTISGKFIKTEIDSICIHGDEIHAVRIAKSIKNELQKKGINFVKLNELSKFS